jgi:hypothetical protein
METIEHILGFCGESHPNIFTIILLVVLFKVMIYKIYKHKSLK